MHIFNLVAIYLAAEALAAGRTLAPSVTVISRDGSNKIFKNNEIFTAAGFACQVKTMPKERIADHDVEFVNLSCVNPVTGGLSQLDRVCVIDTDARADIINLSYVGMKLREGNVDVDFHLTCYYP